MKNSRIIITLILTFFLSSCATVISTVSDGSIEEDRTRRSVGAYFDDNSIETMIKVNIDAADQDLKRSHIQVHSHNGVVLLVGQVPSQELKNMATRIATSANSRVKTVHNELVVAGTTGLLSRSNDVWLGAKLKTLMIADEEINGLKTKIIAENSVIYLMGLVTQREADLVVSLVSNTQGVTKVVRAFEYIN